ncbi:hypothetical protein MNB_SM-3-488 [hydrothermal vent metagenome]|uniref:DUF481 domain-containing protein n=1 Tax=hydrothermal vent metagenome TaxID=652676 RepID=A0A1W1D2D1_9ZZZZ
MKKSIFFSLVFTTSLFSEVITVAPFSVYIDADTKSFKDSGSVNGIYISSGTLSYLMEFTYTHTDIRYKYNTKNLLQDEYTMSYSKYFLDHSYKVGIHTNTTTDTDLQNGVTFLTNFNKWKWKNRLTKINYGGSLFYSYYTNGKDLNENNSSIHITQLALNGGILHYFQYFSNYASITLNYENGYSKSYLFGELKDSIYYKKFTFNIGYFQGKMQTGILDGGASVYNSKDILHQKINLGINYKATPKTSVGISYTNTNYDEYQGKSNLSNNIFTLNASYTI